MLPPQMRRGLSSFFLLQKRIATGPNHSLKNKKADVAEHPKVFHHVGLLINGPPGFTGLPFIQSSDNLSDILQRETRKTNGIFNSCKRWSIASATGSPSAS